MANLSKVQIIGNVGADPEQRYSQQGAMIVQFRVAVNRRGRNPDGSPLEETEWFQVSTTGRLAEICQQYVTKGSAVFVDGRLTLDRWTGQDGQPRFTLRVFANDVQLLGSRPRDGGEGVQPTPMRSRSTPDTDQSDLEDLPF
jgi:single-strand DNA-binding protein